MMGPFATFRKVSGAWLSVFVCIIVQPLVALLAMLAVCISNGFVCTAGMMHGPTLVADHGSSVVELAGNWMSFAILAGNSAGALIDTVA